MQTHQQHSGPGDNVVYKIVIDGKEIKITIPRLLNLVPRPPVDIIGRNIEVNDVRERLKADQPCVLVNGVGGMGKTTVALKYLADFGLHYQHIAWVTVNSTLAETFVTDPLLLASLGLEKVIAALPPEQLYSNGCKMVLHHLSQLNDCLLVLDNVNELADLLQWEAALGSCRVHILLTSRTEPAGWSRIKIDSLLPEQARALFCRYYKYEQPSNSQLDGLLDSLVCHTLLVELCAKSAQASRIPFIELFQRLQDGYIHDRRVNERDVPTGQSGQSIETRQKVARVEDYIELIFSEIAHLFAHETAHLKLFTLLPPAEWYGEDALMVLWQHLLESEAYRPETLDRLVEKGWLQKDDNPTQPLAYKIHPLVQDVAVRRLEVTPEWAASVIKFVADKIHYDATNPTHSLFEKILAKPHAEYLEKLFREAKTEQISHLLDRIAHLDENFGNYRAAQEFGKRAMEINIELFGPDHPTVAVRQSNLANVYASTGDYAQALALFEKSLLVLRCTFAENHPHVIIVQSHIAATKEKQAVT